MEGRGLACSVEYLQLPVSMLPVVGYQPDISVRMSLRNSSWYLNFAMSVSGSSSTDFGRKLVSSDAPFVTLRTDQRPSFKLEFSLCNDVIWQASHKVLVDLDCPPSRFVVVFWTSGIDGAAHILKLDIWVVVIDTAIAVSCPIFLHDNCN